MKRFFLMFIVVSLLLILCSAASAARVTLGIERIGEAEYRQLFTGKRIGLLTNQTGVDSNLTGSVEIMRQKYNLTALFVPEHGFYGAVAAGEEFGNDDYGGVKVFSLYGSSKRPTKEMLDAVDVLCVDLQDIGVRHYTYVSTMAYAMEECDKAGKPVVVLDRPNPLGGAVQGAVLKPEYKSFIGLYEMPLRHGLTIGEYARYINAAYKINCQLAVVPMKGWQRSMTWQDTHLPWVYTSPLIPTADTAFLYAVTGVCGDTNLDIGAATAKPFYFVGAPYADEKEAASALDKLQIKGVKFRPAAYIPRHGKYEGQLVRGVEIYLLDKQQVNLPELGYTLMYTFKNLYPKDFAFPERPYVGGYKIDIALGENSIRNNEAPTQAFARWQAEDKAFERKVQPYLLYK